MTQSRFGSFTYKRFTVPQEVHRSAKRLSLFPLSDGLKRPSSFSLQRRPGRTSPPPPEAETVRPLMSCEPPQCSHVLSGMANYSLEEYFMIPVPSLRGRAATSMERHRRVRAPRRCCCLNKHLFVDRSPSRTSRATHQEINRRLHARREPLNLTKRPHDAIMDQRYSLLRTIHRIIQHHLRAI